MNLKLPLLSRNSSLLRSYLVFGTWPFWPYFFQEKAQADTLHFWDGERKIDIVLAFEDDENGPEDIRKAEKRKTFQRNLEEQGLELELEPSHVSMTQCEKTRNLL